MAEKAYKSIRSADEKVLITWDDLLYETLEKDAVKSSVFSTAYKKKVILNHLSGRAESGQLLAILGPTGCGKTSLLNVLAARVPMGGSKLTSLQGSIKVNGKPRNEDHFRSISAYVLQDDNMYAYLTVFETLMLSAHFYLPDSVSYDEKVELVNGTIAELGLVKAKDTIIGNDKVRGVSGGERRRASIAVQLLCDPAVLFLDEPTSGLDAFQSQAVMESMKKLANSGRLVIAVVHQPRSSIFEMFDKLLLLSEGRTMFYGEAKDSVAYFQTLRYSCPEDFNPSDFFLDLLSPDNRSGESEVETRNRIRFVGDSWLAHEQSRAAAKESEGGHEDAQFTEYKSVKAIGTEFSWRKTIRNFTLLCWRSWTEQSRNIPAIVTKFVSALFFALIIGGIYSNIGYSQQSIQNRKGVLFFLLVNQGFNSVFAVLNSFPVEKSIVNRERSGNAYSALSYCVAKIFVETPLNLLPIVMYAAIVHPMIEMNKDTYGFFILIQMMTNFVAIILGLAISALAPNADAANAIGPSFVIIGILFGGFYISVDSLPIVLNWIPYISMFQWAFRALATNEFQGLEFTCDSPDPSQCISTGEEALAGLDYAGHSTSYAVFGLGMLMLCYIVGLYAILVLSTFKYSPLGHAGATFKAKSKDIAPTNTTYGSEKAVSGSYEMVSVSQEAEQAQENTSTLP